MTSTLDDPIAEREVSATVARAHLSELLDRVEQGADFIIVRHGRPVAVITSPEALRPRSAQRAYRLADQLAADLDAASSRPFGAAPAMHGGWVERKLSELDEHRASR